MVAVGVGSLTGGAASGDPKADPKAARAPIQSKDPKPTPVDIKAFKDKLEVFRDAAGGTYVVLNDPAQDRRAWFGTGKTLYEQVVIGRSSDGDGWSISTWAPRVAEVRPGSISRLGDGTYQKSCGGDEDATLALLTGDKAKAVLDKSAFMSPALVRRAHLLTRDDSGVYYYIDRLDRAHGSKGYRVFVGKKGAMKEATLTDVASDTAGQVFSTKTGDLRLVTTHDDQKPTARWIRGEKKTDLVSLDIDANSQVIFRDLGIYEFLGTICDNI